MPVPVCSVVEKTTLPLSNEFATNLKHGNLLKIDLLFDQIWFYYFLLAQKTTKLSKNKKEEIWRARALVTLFYVFIIVPSNMIKN